MSSSQYLLHNPARHSKKSWYDLRYFGDQLHVRSAPTTVKSRTTLVAALTLSLEGGPVAETDFR